MPPTDDNGSTHAGRLGDLLYGILSDSEDEEAEEDDGAEEAESESGSDYGISPPEGFSTPETLNVNDWEPRRMTVSFEQGPNGSYLENPQLHYEPSQNISNTSNIGVSEILTGSPSPDNHRERDLPYETMPRTAPLADGADSIRELLLDREAADQLVFDISLMQDSFTGLISIEQDDDAYSIDISVHPVPIRRVSADETLHHEDGVVHVSHEAPEVSDDAIVTTVLDGLSQFFTSDETVEYAFEEDGFTIG